MVKKSQILCHFVLISMGKNTKFIIVDFKIKLTAPAFTTHIVGSLVNSKILEMDWVTNTS